MTKILKDLMRTVQKITTAMALTQTQVMTLKRDPHCKERRINLELHSLNLIMVD